MISQEQIKQMWPSGGDSGRYLMSPDGRLTKLPEYAPNTLKANETQIAGDHYKQFKGHEPWDVITAWNLGYLDGTALKYIARWKHKGGIEDLKKAIHFLQKTIEVEEEKVKNGLSGGS